MGELAGIAARALTALKCTANPPLLTLLADGLLILFLSLLVLAHMVHPNSPPQNLRSVQIICQKRPINNNSRRRVKTRERK